MPRKYVDCREYPESNCSVAVSADNEDELVEAVVEHGVKKHGLEDTPAFREEIRRMAHEGSPPA